MKRLLALLLLLPAWAHAQELLTEAQAVTQALARHPGVRGARAERDRALALRGTSVNLPQPQLITEAPSGTFYTAGVNQRLEFPTVYTRQRALADRLVAAAEAGMLSAEATVAFRTRAAYLAAQLWSARALRLASHDSLLQGFVAAAELRYRLGQSRYLDKLNGEARARLVRQQRDQAIAQHAASREQLGLLLGRQLTQGLLPLSRPTQLVPVDTALLEGNPLLQQAGAFAHAAQAQVRVERAKTLPGLDLGYLNQGEQPDNPARMNFRLGVSVPLWWWEPRGRIRAARAGAEAADARRDELTLQLQTELSQVLADIRQAEQTLATFDDVALTQTYELIRAAGESYRLGETTYLAYLSSLEQAFTLQMAYLDALAALRQAQLSLDLLRGRTSLDSE